MPRIRSIKPDFFTSEDVSVLPLRARLTWIGLWTQCDDHGRTKDVARLIKAALWPLDDVSVRDVEQDLITLADHTRIVRYLVDGKGFLAVVNWHAHQAINRPGKSRHPAPPVLLCPPDPADPAHCPVCYADFMAQPVDNTGAEAETAGQTGNPNTHGTLTKGSRTTHGALTPGKEGKGKEGTRARTNAGTLTEPSRPDRDQEPPLRCPDHEHDPAPPACGACADARRTHDAWTQRQRDRPTPTASSPPCPRHPEHPASRCPACDAEAQPAPDLRALREQSTQPQEDS